MASVPARRASQQQSSPDRESLDQNNADSPILARSAISEDSQTLYLNKPQDPSNVPPEPNLQRGQDPTDDPSVKKCWICFADSTEDTPETSPWRDPCPCVLVAHEECLLDWIADMEAPQKDASRMPSKIQCPQCKSEIKLSRPRDVVVEAVRGLEKQLQYMTLPAGTTVATLLLYGGSMAFGMHTIHTIFGREDGFRILRPLLENAVRPPLESYTGEPRDFGRQLLALAQDRLRHWQLYVGVPLITPALVASRFTIADSILPVLPIAFLATQNHYPDQSFDIMRWPPSASLSFALLPYVRSMYNLYYRSFWAEKEQQWLQEVQPRHGQGQTGDAANANQEAVDGEDDEGNVFEVRIGGDAWDDDWEDEAPAGAPNAENQQPQPDQAQPPPAEGVPQPGNVPQQDHAPADPPPDIADDRPAAANPPRANERRLSFSPISLAQTLLTALLYPTLANLSGEALRLVLPTSWTAAPPPASSSWLLRGALAGGERTPAKGLLQEKWGRSLVGGCLFLVVKDAMMLYVRWRMAEMHRKRRVVNYEGRRGRAAT